MSQAVGALQAVVADRGTSARLYAPALEGLRRLTIGPGGAARGGPGTRAAKALMLSTWGLVDQQNNRGF